MSTLSSPAPSRSTRPGSRMIVSLVVALVVIVAMAWSTKVVKIGSPAAVQPGTFSPAPSQPIGRRPASSMASLWATASRFLSSSPA